MTITIWLVMYVIVGILFAEAIIKHAKNNDPISYIKVMHLHKIIYVVLTCLWVPLILFSIIKMLLRDIFK